MGKLDYLTRIAPTLDALLARSDLPEQADTAYWDRLLCNVIERELFNRP